MSEPTDLGAPDYLAQIAENTAKANELLDAIHSAIELSGAPRSEREGIGDDPPRVVTLSYLLFKQQSEYGQNLGGAMSTILGYLFLGTTVEDVISYPSGWQTGHWSKDRMHLSADAERLEITYTYKGIDPDKSAFDIGTEKRLSETPYEQKGAGYLIDLSEDDSPLAFEREESVTLEQSSTVEITDGMEIDVGTEAEISGSIPGTGLEAKISASFGYKDTHEEKQAREQSRSQSTTAKIALEAEARKVTRVGVISNAVHSETPKGWHGTVDYKITITAPLRGDNAIWLEPAWSPIGYLLGQGKRFSEQGGRASWTWENMNEWLSFLDGTDTEMRAFIDRGVSTWPSAPKSDIPTDLLVNARELIRNGPLSRHVSVDGIDVRDYKEGADIDVEDVTGQDIDAVAQAHDIPDNHIISPHPQRGAEELIDRMGNTVLYLGSCGQYHRTPPTPTLMRVPR